MISYGGVCVYGIRKATCLQMDNNTQRKDKWQSYNHKPKDILEIFVSLWDPCLALGRKRDAQNLFWWKVYIYIYIYENC